MHKKKNNFRGIFSLNETLKSFSSTRPRTIRQFNMAAIFQWLELLFRRINSFLVSIMGDWPIKKQQNQLNKINAQEKKTTFAAYLT